MDPRPETAAGRNWAGNVAYSAERLVEPASIDELADALRGAGSAKALGTRHCFNRIADTGGVLVSTRALPADIAIDETRGVVRVGGGVRYGDLAGVLSERGFALANLASLPHISIAGAVATGTHGSGDGNRSLAAAVAAVELLTADGEIVQRRRGEPDFDGVVVSLGALGIVTAVELDVEPAYDIAQTVYEGLPFERVVDDLSAVTSLGYSTSLFTTWQHPDVIDQLWLKRRADAAGDAPDDVLGASRAPVKRHPLPGVDPEFCTDQLGVPGPWAARLPHFKLEFTPSNGDELQSEYLVPRAHAADALRAVRALAGSIAPLLQVCEVRTVAADALWLSPAYDTDVVGIHFTWKPDQPAVEAFLPTLETAFEPFGTRPHWGKVFDVDAAASRLPGLYPRLREFADLRERLDPRGVFRNDFVSRLGL